MADCVSDSYSIFLVMGHNLMTLLPFLLLPYNFLLAIDTPSDQLSWKSDIPKQGPQQ